MPNRIAFIPAFILTIAAVFYFTYAVKVGSAPSTKVERAILEKPSDVTDKFSRYVDAEYGVVCIETQAQNEFSCSPLATKKEVTANATGLRRQVDELSDTICYSTKAPGNFDCLPLSATRKGGTVTEAKS